MGAVVLLVLVFSSAEVSSYSGPGDGFVKVFSHNTAGGLFSSQDDAVNKNPGNPDAELFSILDQLEDYRDHEGIFHFKLCYPEITGVGGGRCNEWTQASNPVYYSTIQGFQEISLAFLRDGNNNSWRGLGRSHSKFSFLDDTPADDTQWTAIGATALGYSSAEFKKMFNKFSANSSLSLGFLLSCIPGPIPHCVTKVELYISSGKNQRIPLFIHIKT